MYYGISIEDKLSHTVLYAMHIKGVTLHTAGEIIIISYICIALHM